MKLKVIAYNERYDEYVCKDKHNDTYYVNPHTNSSRVPCTSRLGVIGKKFKMPREATQIVHKAGTTDWVWLPCDGQWVECKAKKRVMDAEFYVVEL